MRKAVIWAISIAATLAVVLLVKNFTAGTPNNQQFYAQYAQSEELIHKRGPDNNLLRRQAHTLNNAKNYTSSHCLKSLLQQPATQQPIIK
ncbi:MAG: hypothetical protein ABIX01_19000 [Chitinophagaceae bacterium]